MKRYNDQKHLGAFETPLHVASLVARAAVEISLLQSLNIKYETNSKELSQFLGDSKYREGILREILKLRILDNSCGSGIFLLATAEYLEALCHSLGYNDDHKHLIGALGHARRFIVENQLYGVDICPNAITKCMRRLNTFVSQGNDKIMAKATLPNLELHFRVADTLLSTSVESDPPRSGDLIAGIKTESESVLYSNFDGEDVRSSLVLDWNRAFPKIFSSKGGFDLVIGNPPFVTKEIPLERRKLLRQLYHDVITPLGRLNLAVLFLRQSYDLVKPNGCIAFLLPNTILGDSFSTKLRKFIRTNLNLVKAIDIWSRSKVFSGVLQGSCALFLRKDTSSSESMTSILEAATFKDLIKGDFKEGRINHYRLHRKEIRNQPIVLSADSRVYDLLDKLQNDTITLQEAFGPARSGEIRQSDKPIQSFLIKKETIESRDVFIVVRGRNISPFAVSLNVKRRDAWHYQRPLKDQRIARDYHSEHQRIVFQRITGREQSRRMIAGLISSDEIQSHGRIYVENSAGYILIPQRNNRALNAYLVLGLLNSQLYDWFIRRLVMAPDINPGIVNMLPFPMATLTEQRDTIQSIIEKTQQTRSILREKQEEVGKIATLASELDQLIFDLFELTEEERGMIKTEIAPGLQMLGDSI